MRIYGGGKDGFLIFGREIPYLIIWNFFYLDIALDYALINWGLTLCGGKRSKDSLVNLPQAIEGVYLGQGGGQGFREVMARPFASPEIKQGIIFLELGAMIRGYFGKVSWRGQQGQARVPGSSNNFRQFGKVLSGTLLLIKVFRTWGVTIRS